MNRLIAWLLAFLVGEGALHAQDEEKVAPTLESYWTRDVEAVQPRRTDTAGKLEVVGLAGVIPNDAFLVYVPLGFRVAYHRWPRWAVEISAEVNLAVDTGLRGFLEENDAALRAQIRDRQQGRISAGVLWSPIYGKVALGRRVVHFEAYVVGGAGAVRTAEEEALHLAAAIRPDFHLGGGVRVFAGRRLVVRFEVRQYAFLRPEDSAGRGGGIGFPTELALCSGLLFGRDR